MRKGFAPPDLQKGLFDVLEEVDRDYLAHVPGNSQFDEVLTRERVAARKAYEAKQARIASIPVIPAPGIALPLPGVAFTPAIPMVRSGIMHRQGRGDPPLSITGMLPQPLGCSALRRAEWYESCSIGARILGFG